MMTTTASDAAEVYALGSDADESARLRRQSDELRPQTAELLGHIGLRPGQSAIDFGCGPSGILELLSAAVAPGGRVVGLDADPAHTAMASKYASELALANVEVVTADARRTGLPPGSFDLVHARTLLVTIPEPEEVLAEMVRLAKPGGWVARNPTSNTRCAIRRCPPGTGCAGSSPSATTGSAPTSASAAACRSCSGRPGCRTSRSRCTRRPTRPVTRAARCCRTWCAACAR